MAQISLPRIRANLRAMEVMAGPGQVMAVVKANAYGHGAPEIARTLADEGVRFFAVAHVSEALELRRAGIVESILVMGVPFRKELPVFAKEQLDVLVGSGDTVSMLAGGTGSSSPLNVHLKVDTGMHRLGLAPSDVGPAIEALASVPGVRLRGLWTHMASADEPDSPFTREQWRRMSPIVRAFGDRFDFVHILPTSGAANFPDLVTESSRTLTRAGIGLYGYVESEMRSQSFRIAPAMKLASRVAQVRTIDAGESASYNRTWTASERTKIATVAAGYADGYMRALSNRSEIGIGGNRHPVVGSVCMDMCVVSLGPAASAPSVREGDEAVLFGDGGPSAFEVADWADTIVYEICTSISSRVLREYH